MTHRLFATGLIGLGFLTACIYAQSDDSQKSVGSIEIVKMKEGEYGYRVKNADGKTLLLPPDRMSWSDAAAVRKVIQDLSLTISTPPFEDPLSKEEFKDKESRHSFRIKNAKGTIIAVPPQELQWNTKTELLDAIREVRAILDTATPADADRPALKASELKWIGDDADSLPAPKFSSPSPGLPKSGPTNPGPPKSGQTNPGLPKSGQTKPGLSKKNSKK